MILVNCLPPTTAPIDNATFARMLMATFPNCLSSIKLLVSSANEDIVVSEPQNPTAASKVYFESKFHKRERIENTPKIKLPITLMTRILIGSVPSINGDSANLNLTKAPATAPTVRNTNSIPFIFSYAHHMFSIFGRHYQHLAKGRFWLTPRLMPQPINEINRTSK